MEVMELHRQYQELQYQEQEAVAVVVMAEVLEGQVLMAVAMVLLGQIMEVQVLTLQAEAEAVLVTEPPIIH
jgi:hypothetical protein